MSILRLNKVYCIMEGEGEDCIKMLQAGVVNTLIKKHIVGRAVSAEYKKEFRKALSLFALYVQSHIEKKKYGKDDLIAALEKCGFGKVAADVREGEVAQKGKIDKEVLQLEEGN